MSRMKPSAMCADKLPMFTSASRLNLDFAPQQVNAKESTGIYSGSDMCDVYKNKRLTRIRYKYITLISADCECTA